MTEENEKVMDAWDPQPIYKGDDGYLYVYYADTGALYNLRPAEFIGKPGAPLPESFKQIGRLTLLGMFRLTD